MKKTLLIILGVIILVFLYIFSAVSPAIYRTVKTPDSMQNLTITGHRGAAAYAPENTIASLKKAMELNVNRVEIDVHQTKDGRIVVMHDNTLDRTTNGSGVIAEMNYDEMSGFLANVGFESEFPDEKIPLLSEVLELVCPNNVLLIEVKEGSSIYPGIEQKVIDLINTHGIAENVIVQSFRDEVLENTRKLAPEIILHKLFLYKLPLIPVINDDTWHWKSLKSYDVEEFGMYFKLANKGIII